MSSSRRTLFSLGAMDVGRMRRAAADHGAAEPELAALERLDSFQAERVDLVTLAPLARIAGLPWAELFPEVAQWRPTTKRELERKLRGVQAVTKAFGAAFELPPLACDAHAPSGEQCELERGHAGKHVAPRRGSKVFSAVRWST